MQIAGTNHHPIKDNLISADNTFTVCDNLKHVDLVEGELQDTIAALQLDDWRNDMLEEIDSINRILPNALAGVNWNDDTWSWDYGEKAAAISRWVKSVLGKIIHYKAQHQRILDEAATTLQLDLPRDILKNNVLPFLELP